MIGHLPIINLRKQGFSPTVIFVSDVYDSNNWYNPGEKYGEVWEHDHATVCILPDEPLELLDLRFCVGLRVLANFGTEKRAKQVLEAFKGASAQTVVSSHCYQVEGKDFFTTGWSEVWNKN